MKLRVGLIGVGYWGTQLVRTLSAHPDAELGAVTDVDSRRLSGLSPSMMRVGSIADLCALPSIDAVMVATPPATHFAVARAILQAGKHCWVEKPLALSVADARALVDLARESQRTLFVDETFLYDPLVQRARDWIHSGRLGRIFHYSFERLSIGRVRRDSDIWWNAAPHDLALLRTLAQSPVATIKVERFAYLQPEVADVCVGTVRLADGASVHLYMSWLSPLRTGRVVAVGSAGMLVFDGRFGARSLTFFTYRSATPARVHDNVIPIEEFAAAETIPGGHEEPLALAVTAFVRAVRTGEPAPSDGAASLETVRLLALAG